MKQSPLNGLVIGFFQPYERAGMDKALVLIEPFLRVSGIEIFYFSDKTVTTFFFSIARYLKKKKLHRPDFVIFNALSSLWLVPYSYLLMRFFSWLRIPVFIYWRELKMAFTELEQRNPKAIRTVDKIVKSISIIHLANSGATASFLKERFPFIEPKVVLNCAYVPNEFCTPVEPYFDPPLVVNVGSIQYKKGVDLFVKSAIEVCKVHPTVEFMWLGSGELDKELIEMIKLYGFTSRILFPGYCETPFVLTRRAAIVFISSRSDSFSQATAEAMCQAKTVICYESGGPPEVLGDTGIVIKGFDYKKTSEVIIDLLNKDKKDLINLNARRRYIQYFTPEVHANRVISQIRTVLMDKDI